MPEDAYAHLRLGAGQEQLGDLAAAAESLSRAQVLSGPATEPARRRLERLVSERTQLLALEAKAQAWLEDALERRPRSLFILPEVGPHPIYWWDSIPSQLTEMSLPSDYVGILEQGPEPQGHPVRTIDHVLPCGLEQRMKTMLVV